MIFLDNIKIFDWSKGGARDGSCPKHLVQNDRELKVFTRQIVFKSAIFCTFIAHVLSSFIRTYWPFICDNSNLVQWFRFHEEFTYKWVFQLGHECGLHQRRKNIMKPESHCWKSRVRKCRPFSPASGRTNVKFLIMILRSPEKDLHSTSVL